MLMEVLEAAVPYVVDSVIRGTGSWQYQGNSTLCWTQDTTSPSSLEQAKPGASLPRPQGSSRPEEVPFLSWHTGPEKVPPQGVGRPRVQLVPKAGLQSPRR